SRAILIVALVLLPLLPPAAAPSAAEEIVELVDPKVRVWVQQQVNPRFFPQTGFNISDDRFFDYFNKRGGLPTFGFPVSRSFTLLGTTVQFFQRRIMQLQPDGSVGLLNVMDPGLMPFNVINGATLPSHDPAIATQAPQPGSPNFGPAATAFLQQFAPNSFEGRPVNFFNTFMDTVPPEAAFPPGQPVDPGLLLGFDLEMWGFPTSAPTVDPNNFNFVYLRFQRGIMHFDGTNGLTQGLLMADFFKSIITGQNLPPDLAVQAQGSPFFLQFNNAAPLGLNRPEQLPGTDMTDAFIPEPGPAVPIPPLTGINGLRYGMQAHMFGQPQDTIIDLLYLAGFRWLKQQIRWADFEKSPGNIDFATLDQLVDTASRRQTPLLFSVVTSPSWTRADGLINGPPDDFNTFGNFLFALASRYRGRVAAYEIWNEQNLRREWAGRPLDPGLYIELLRVAQARIKQADPGASVVSGALTPTGINDGVTAVDDVAYLQGMYTYQGGVFKTLADAVGSHMAGYNNAPEDFVDFHTVNTPGFKDHPSFYFRRIDQLHDVMAANGDPRQMWITEYEWASTAPPVPVGFEWTTHLTEAQVSDFLVRSIESIQTSRPWVGAIFIWNLNFRTFGDPHVNETAIFGILDPGFIPRPMYVALQNLAK
ncbi:MAG: hypothetical protein HYY30_04415, partial [Chloroflexi bacterium]|nr:hypothetical protein [Chloroflexota bacterium]